MKKHQILLLAALVSLGIASCGGIPQEKAQEVMPSELITRISIEKMYS